MARSPFGSRASARPSPPWYGAVQTGLLFLDVAWLLAYTLLALPPLEALGGWNYAGMLAVIVLSTVVAQGWRCAEYVRPARLSPPYPRPPG